MATEKGVLAVILDDIIGGTPLAALPRLTAGLPGRLAVRLEYLNPLLAQRETILSRNLAHLRGAVQQLDDAIARSGGRFRWQRPVAGTMGFVRLADGWDAATFSRDLREQIGVLVVPSEVMNYGTRHTRIGFGRHDFAAGLDRLAAFCRRSPAPRRTRRRRARTAPASWDSSRSRCPSAAGRAETRFPGDKGPGSARRAP